MLSENQMQDASPKVGSSVFSPIGARRFQATTSIIQATNSSRLPSEIVSPEVAAECGIGCSPIG
jgi:hypothetical protein